MTPRRHGSLFTGIAGFELGFRMAGWDTETVWQSEIDPFCLELLAERFPDARQLGNVTEVDVSQVAPVDVVTAGFPCQPVSDAGQKLAQDDERWLWPEVKRVVEAVRPPLLLVENVRGLRSRGLCEVLADLVELGYDAQWDLVPAAAVGAPHLRHRFWIVAYPQGTAMGHVFERPPVFVWPDEEPCKPRLLSKVHRRRERLTALGNAIVPHMACWLALAVDRARESGVLAAPSLFGVPVSSYGKRPPAAGVLIDGLVHETDTCVPKLNGRRLWPTAAATDAEWGIEALAACVHVDGSPAHDPHMRFYHPVTGQIVQRTLHNYVVGAEAGLWPTPQAADGNGKGAAPARGAQEDGGWRSVNLIDAVAEAEDELYPTPQVADAEGGRVSPPETRATGKRPSGAKAQRTLREAVDDRELLPTPTAADGEKGSRRSTARTDEWESHTGSTLLDAAHELEGDELWPSPRAGRAGRTARVYPGHVAEGSHARQADGGHGDLEEEVARRDGELWPTAAASDHKGSSAPGQRRGQLEEAVKEHEKVWPTPNAADAAGGRTTAGAREGGPPLNAEVHRQESLWETPTAAPWSGGGAGGVLQEQVKIVQGEEIGGWSRDGASPTNPGRSLNPGWVEWLQGYPPGWTELGASVAPSNAVSSGA